VVEIVFAMHLGIQLGRLLKVGYRKVFATIK